MLISNAYAQAAGAADPTGGLMGLLPMILMFVVIWFLMIRPQMKRAKEHKALVAALAKGDESSPRAAWPVVSPRSATPSSMSRSPTTWSS